MPGLQTTPPDVQTAPVADLGGDRPDLERELGRSGERVAPLVHRRRSRMRRLARPGDLVALHAEGPEHDAERQVERLEHRPLLDVQLEIRGRALELRARIERAVEVDAVLAQRVGQRDSVRVGALSKLVLVGHRAGCGRRAEERTAEARAFLVRPVDEPHGERRRALGGDPAQHLDAGDDVEAAVEPAAVRHRVDVPADQERTLGGAAKREPLVARLVDLLRRAGLGDLVAKPARAPSPTSSVQATRWAPFSSPVSSRSSFSSATVRDGSSGIAGDPTTGPPSRRGVIRTAGARRRCRETRSAPRRLLGAASPCGGAGRRRRRSSCSFSSASGSCIAGSGARLAGRGRSSSTTPRCRMSGRSSRPSASRRR